MQITSLSCKQSCNLENIFSILPLTELKKLFRFEENMNKILDKAIEMKYKWMDFKKICHLITERYRGSVGVFNICADSATQKDSIVEALHQIFGSEIIINSSIDPNIIGFSIHIWHDGTLYDSTDKSFKRILEKKIREEVCRR